MKSSEKIRKLLKAFFIFSLIFIISSPLALGHQTPGDNFDGYGRLYGFNRNKHGQGKEKNNCKDQKESSDPVNPATGEFTESVTDLYILGRIPITIRRTYRSQRQHYSSSFGANWFFIYDYKMSKIENGNLLLTFPSGDESVFLAQGNGLYQPCCGDTTVITENPDGTYTLKPRGFRYYIFDMDGKLIRLEETSGDGLNFIYEKEKKAIQGPFRYSTGGQKAGVLSLRERLIKIIDDWQREVSFTYYEEGERQGRVKSVIFMPGTEHRIMVSYDYDEEGNLISVTSPASPRYPNGTTTHYTYSSDHSSPKLNHNIISITAPKEFASGKDPYLINKYDSEDRVVEQKYGDGTYYFTYTEKNNQRVTTVKDRSGNINTTVFNENGNPIKDIYKGLKLRPDDLDEYVFINEYDPNSGHLVKAINPSGIVRVHKYDERGNIIETRRKTKDGPDSDDDVVSRFTYEKRFDRIKTHTDPLGRTTTYDYDYEEAERGDLNGDGITNQEFGQLIREILPPSEPGGKSPVYQYRYNKHAQFISNTDPLGRITKIEYYETGISGGRVHKYTNDANDIAATTILEYDALGNKIAITNPNGHTARFEYDPKGDITRSISAKPFEDKVDYYYDENGNLFRVDIENKDPNGQVDPQNPVITFVSEYDLLDNIVAEKIEVGNVNAEVVEGAQESTEDVLVTRMAYDIDDRLEQVTHPEGLIERFEYDGRGLILRNIRAPGTPEETVSHLTYSIDGYLTEVKDDNGHITRYVLDGFNRIKETIDPVGNRLTGEYDPVGNLIKQEIYGTDGKLLSCKEWEYDGEDRIKWEHIHFFGPDGKPLSDGPLTPNDGRVSTLFEYDIVGNLIRVTDDNENTYHYFYDGLDRLIKEIDPLGNSTTYIYDKEDNLLNMQEVDKHPEGEQDVLTTYRFKYDALNRLVKTVDPLLKITEFSYDSRGNMVYQKDAKNNGLHTIYDSLSRVICIEQELRDENGAFIKSIKESYTYYGREQLASITDDNGNTTNFFYNALGLRNKIRYADGSLLSMTVDGVGNLLETIDPRGIKTTYTYYKDDMLHTATTGDTVEIFTYDGMGRMLSASVMEAEKTISNLSWEYDSMDNPVTSIQDEKLISRMFNGVGNLLEQTCPDGKTLRMTYDPLDRTKDIIRDNRKVTEYTYIGPDRIYSQKFGNNTSLSLEYDKAQRIVKNIHRENNTGFDGSNYEYDALGQRILEKRLPDTGIINRFKYDSAGRLTEARYNDRPVPESFKFELDGAGNLISQTINGKKTLFNHDPTGQYTPDPLNRYTNIQGQDQGYDYAGNMTFDGKFRYLYNHKNLLVEVQEADTNVTIARYGYDAIGRRISKQTAEGIVTYIYDGFKVIAEYNGDNNLSARYIYGNGIDEVLQMECNGKTYTFQSDAQGSITSITDSAGKIVETYTYSPFGAVAIHDANGNTLNQSSIGNPYLFTGRRLDPETGLYYFRYRMYDPQTGRFLQRDPLGFLEGANLYLYAMGDPINLIDPMGLGFWGDVWLYTKTIVVKLPSEVAKSFMDGRANDSLEGFVYNYGCKYLGMNNSPTYGHKKAFKGGKKIADVTKEFQKAVIISAATGGLGNAMKAAKVFQVCSKSGRIVKYIAFKVIDAGIDTATEYIMDKNGKCWTAEEFAKRFGMNALYSVLGDAAAATLTKIMGAKGSVPELMEKFATGGPGCFIAGTLVATENGLIPIEEINIGDKVWAMDPETGEITLNEVINAFWREVDILYLIEIDGEIIETTKEHPFWIQDKGWIEARDLLINDRLLTPENKHFKIDDLTVNYEKNYVFNLTVNDISTYFVSNLKILVHNVKKCPPMSKEEALKHGLSERDPQWPWRGLHKIEGHHPLMQGKSFKKFWKERGFSNAEVKRFITDLDTDIHGAITNSGWWEDQLFGKIAAQEKVKKGLLNKDEVLKIAKDLLEEIAGWGK